MENLLRTLRQAFPDTASRAPNLRFLPDSPYSAGLETRARTDTSPYHWDGLRRGGDLAQPFVVFQVTLEGFGAYEDGTGRHIAGAGRAFAAIIPSAHRYFLPPESGHWTFFYLLIRHPYAVARITERQQAAGTALLDLAESSIVVSRATTLLLGGFPDRWAEEEALLQFVIACDRHIAQTSDSGIARPERERLLEAARRFVLENMGHPAGVAELADVSGMSRSRFSHYFRDITGQSPAQYMARIRLEEASRRLVQTDSTLAHIAVETGFADANHLCKAFRRQFRISPGAFRRQVR